MDKYTDIKEEMATLIEEGNKLVAAIEINKSGTVTDLHFFIQNYEIWYSKALLVVKQLLPDREEDFMQQYKLKNRKTLSCETYTISDALSGLFNKNKNFGPQTARFAMFRQVKILRACLESFDSKLKNLQFILQADIFDSEIESAKHLLKNGFLRAAGAICGVVLEKHFAEICKNRNISIQKKNPTIGDFNDSLKDVAYDVIEWRKIQHLGDVRNLCDHNKDREPTKDEVEELINGTDRVIKTIF